MSYERMKREEARLRAEIETMLTQADAADREEDEYYGSGRDGADLPEELQRRGVRLRRIQEAKSGRSKPVGVADPAYVDVEVDVGVDVDV